MSKTVGLLTPLIQIFFKLIHPFKWILPYVPLLPCSQLEYLEAPNPFIMGISSEFEDQINKENELILIDIDTGEVKIPDSIVLHSFPNSHLVLFKEKLKEVDFNFVQNQILTK